MGGVSALFFGLQVGNYLKRRPVLVFDTGYGSIRVSREVLEAIFTERARIVPGVYAARIRSRWRRGQTRIRLWLDLEDAAEIESRVGEVIARLYRTVADLTAASPVSVELIIEEIRTV